MAKKVIIEAEVRFYRKKIIKKKVGRGLIITINY